MNLETINKWLDEEYGCSYTRLEELHNFYFEKYCDLKQENKQLKEKLDCDLQWAFKYEKQVDNWNKLKKYIRGECLMMFYADNYTFECVLEKIIEKMQELEQGSDSNE